MGAQHQDDSERTAVPLRAILFDAVGTLIYPQPSVAAIYAETGRRFGSSLDEAEIAQRFRAAFAAAERDDRLRGDLRTSEPRERARWQRIVADVFDDVDDRPPLFAALWQRFAAAENWRLFDDAVDALSSLSASDMVLGIASNFDARLHALRREIPQLAMCPHVFVSSELGYRKPAREFFAAIENALGLEPAAIALIGDDPENDYQAALDAGWRAILIDRGNQLADDGTPRIADLRKLHEALGRVPR